MKRKTDRHIHEIKENIFAFCFILIVIYSFWKLISDILIHIAICHTCVHWKQQLVSVFGGKCFQKSGTLSKTAPLYCIFFYIGSNTKGGGGSSNTYISDNIAIGMSTKLIWFSVMLNNSEDKTFKLFDYKRWSHFDFECFSVVHSITNNSTSNQ